MDSILPNQTRYLEWNLLGDPELNVWTETPRLLTVDYDTIVFVESTDFSVLVNCAGAPVPNALVCVMMDSTIYNYGYTDSTGEITFTFTPQHTGLLQVTVTAHNYFPYEGTVSVQTAGVEECLKLDAKGKTIEIYPNPTKSVLRVRYPLSGKETANLKIFDVSGKLIKDVALTASESHNDQEREIRISLKGINPGIYFLRLGKETKKFLVVK
jgi:hypothetical protein